MDKTFLKTHIQKTFLTRLMSSNVLISGDNPPCTQRNCWFIKAARGRQSNASIHASYTFSLYLILPTSKIGEDMKTSGFSEYNFES